MTDHELASHIFAYIVNQTVFTDSKEVKEARSTAFIDGVSILVNETQMQAAKQIIMTEYGSDLDDPTCYPEDQGAEAISLLASALVHI